MTIQSRTYKGEMQQPGANDHMVDPPNLNNVPPAFQSIIPPSNNNHNGVPPVDDRDRPIREHLVPILDDLNPVIARPAINGVSPIDVRKRTVREHLVPTLDDLNPGIAGPAINAAVNFELKTVMFQMLQLNGHFSGSPTEDPLIHLRSFIDVCDSFVQKGVPQEVLKLKLFPYSLRGKARAWLNTFPPGSVTSWNTLAQKFLLRFYSLTMNAKLRNDITSFQQLDDESLYETWERFKELLGLQHWAQMEIFYIGLNAHTRMVVDVSSNGTLLDKSYNEAYDILERVATNDRQYPTTRVMSGRRVVAAVENDALNALTTQVAALTDMMKTMQRPGGMYEVKATNVSCMYCNENHDFEECPQNPESVCYLKNFNLNNNTYGNTCNPSFNNPGISLNSNFASTQQQYEQQQPMPPFQPNQQQQRTQQSSQSYISSILELLEKIVLVNVDVNQRNEALFQSQSALENQVAQLANALNTRPYRTCIKSNDAKELNCKAQATTENESSKGLEVELSKPVEPIVSTKEEDCCPTCLEGNDIRLTHRLVSWCRPQV